MRNRVGPMLMAAALLAGCGGKGNATAERNGAAAKPREGAASSNATGAEASAASDIASAYTELDLARCQTLSQVEEGDSQSWRCPGYQGVPLFVSTGDLRTDIDAGVDNGNFETLPPFNDNPNRVEWRVRNGQPFAIIYRLSLAREGDTGWSASALGVARVGRSDAPGCVVAWVDGDVPNANEMARNIADTRAAGFGCGSAEPEMIHRSGSQGG